MFVGACAIALLCLVSVSHSAPLTCENLVRPLDQDPRHLEGRWALVAASRNNSAAAEVLKGRESINIDLYNSSYTLAFRTGVPCRYQARNFSVEGHHYTIKWKTLNITVTFFNTSCVDCMVLTLDVVSPNYKSVDFYLFSRRREVDQREMEEFRAQVECLKMPLPIVMDPTKELCPEQTASEPAAQTEEKAEGQKA